MTPCNFADRFICITDSSDWLKLKFTGDFFLFWRVKSAHSCRNTHAANFLILQHNFTREERLLHTTQLMKNFFKPLDRFPSDEVWLIKIDKHLYDYCMFGILNKVFFYGSTVYRQQS